MEKEDVQSKDAFCYCAVNSHNRIFKVGYSKDVHARIKQQNGVNLVQIELKLVCPGSRLIESALHFRLRRFKYKADKKREWFALNNESANIVVHHFKHGFSTSYLKRVLWRKNFRTNKYAEKIANRRAKRAKSILIGPDYTAWAPIAARLIDKNRNEVLELERKFSVPSGHRLAFSDIANKASAQTITDRQYKFLCGIMKSYLEAPQIAERMTNGDYLLEKADKQCKICLCSECSCGFRLTRRVMSHAVWQVFGGVEYARRHGYAQPSEALKKFIRSLHEILKAHGAESVAA